MKSTAPHVTSTASTAPNSVERETFDSCSDGSGCAPAVPVPRKVECFRVNRNAWPTAKLGAAKGNCTPLSAPVVQRVGNPHAARIGGSAYLSGAPLRRRLPRAVPPAPVSCEDRVDGLEAGGLQSHAHIGTQPHGHTKTHRHTKQAFPSYCPGFRGFHLCPGCMPLLSPQTRPSVCLRPSARPPAPCHLPAAPPRCRYIPAANSPAAGFVRSRPVLLFHAHQFGLNSPSPSQRPPSPSPSSPHGGRAEPRARPSRPHAGARSALPAPACCVCLSACSSR